MNWTAEQLIRDFVEANQNVEKYNDQLQRQPELFGDLARYRDSWKKHRTKIIKDMEEWIELAEEDTEP